MSNASIVGMPAGGETVAPIRYRAVAPAAVLSVVFGAASIVVFFHWLAVVVPVCGLVFGWRALKQVERSVQETTGAGLALGGMALSAGMGLLGGVLYLWTGRYEVPIGYKVISFENFVPDEDKPFEVPPDLDKLEGERVFIRGFMFPGRQVANLKEFILVPSMGHCNFCSKQLKSIEMIRVVMGGDLRADYTTKMTRVGGRLKIDREAYKIPYGSLPITIECDYVR